MVNFLTKAALVAAAVTPFVTAQTSTTCDPTKKTCPADTGLNQASYTVDFTKGMPSDWSMTFQKVTIDPNLGANFSISGYNDAPTMQSNWFLFFGKVECTMQTAPGAGIVSSFILISDDLDELDVEVVGGDTTHVQSNYFGKGNTTTYDRGAFHPVTNPQSSLHTYTIDWNSDKTTWAIDGNVVRTLNYGDAVGGKNYPQTPMQIRLGNWVAGRPGNAQGTIDWSGGIADLKQAPFNFYVKTCTVTNYNPASSYTYGDQSGSFQSIKKGSGSAVSSSTPSSTSASTSTTVKSVTSGTATTSTVTGTQTGSTSATGNVISSTVTIGVVGNSTVTGYTPISSSTSATTSRPAQVTTNAAPGSYGRTSAYGLGLVAALALLF